MLTMTFYLGGLVLWSKSFVPTASPLPALIADGLISEKLSGSHDLMETQIGSYCLQWSLSNDFGLIFVVAYQRILQLTYITDLLESIKSLFTSLYSSILESTFNSWNIPQQDMSKGFKSLFKGWDQSFNKLLREIERVSDRKRGGFDHLKDYESDRKAIRSQEDEETNSSHQEQEPTSHTTATDAETIARNIAALKSRKKKGSRLPTSRAESRSGTDTSNTSVIKSQTGKKTARKWENGKITANDMAEYDFSEGVQLDDSNTSPSTLIDQQSMGARNEKGFYEVADFDRGQRDDSKTENKSHGTLFSKIISSIPIFGGQKSGPITLTQADVQPMIEQIQLQLMNKNVAREIAIKICERIQVELVGRKLTDRSTNSLKKLINQSLEASLTKILTPRSSVDILADIQEKQQRQIQASFSQGEGSNAPYVMTFVGVNGVGKSTNLSKVAFWLLQNGLRVLIAACDTFRSGAVEQLRTHVRNLSKLHGTNGGSTLVEQQMIELFEKGYGKDAAGIAKEAIQYATSSGFDVVLIDTAGRMQDNEPLMRALGKYLSFLCEYFQLVVVNQPDKILFVGEALVGNEAVDQLGKFDKSLKAFSGIDNHLPRGIDGIILTKFDTIDDKVGAALSMTYTINQPILFVGTGQTYTDLKSLKVNHVVNALLR